MSFYVITYTHVVTGKRRVYPKVRQKKPTKKELKEFAILGFKNPRIKKIL